VIICVKDENTNLPTVTRPPTRHKHAFEFTLARKHTEIRKHRQAQV